MAKAKVWHYRVRWAGAFPIDMLRYDRAWPRNEADAASISRSMQSNRGFSEVSLTSHNAPTEGRWDSFGARVIDIESRDA